MNIYYRKKFNLNRNSVINNLYKNKSQIKNNYIEQNKNKYRSSSKIITNKFNNFNLNKKAKNFRISQLNIKTKQRTINNNENCEEIKKANFKFHIIIGVGGFGKVWIVENKTNKKFYALKEMSKKQLSKKNNFKKKY